MAAQSQQPWYLQSRRQNKPPDIIRYPSPQATVQALSSAQLASALCPRLWATFRAEVRLDGVQAVKQLTEEVAAMPEGACPDLLILPLYAAMPLELQVCCHA